MHAANPTTYSRYGVSRERNELSENIAAFVKDIWNYALLLSSVDVSQEEECLRGKNPSDVLID